MKFVKIPDREYEIADAPVTQAEWKEIMGTNPSHFKCRPYNPVEMVSWNDCQEFIKKLNDKNDGYKYELPSEKEWEYCCRAWSNKDYCFGNSEKTLKSYAWFEANSKNRTHQVKNKNPNAWGLYDMHGNVWEWTSSLWMKGRTYYVICGGSWNSFAHYLRSAYRGYGDPGVRDSYVGFRLVRTKVSRLHSELIDAIAGIEADLNKLKKVLEGK